LYDLVLEKRPMHPMHPMPGNGSRRNLAHLLDFSARWMPTRKGRPGPPRGGG